MLLYPTIPLETNLDWISLNILNLNARTPSPIGSLFVYVRFGFTARPGHTRSGQLKLVIYKRLQDSKVCGYGCANRFLMCGIFEIYVYINCLNMYPLQSFVREWVLFPDTLSFCFCASILLFTIAHIYDLVWEHRPSFSYPELSHFLLPDFLLCLALHTQETELLTPEGKKKATRGRGMSKSKAQPLVSVLKNGDAGYMRERRSEVCFDFFVLCFSSSTNQCKRYMIYSI